MERVDRADTSLSPDGFTEAVVEAGRAGVPLAITNAVVGQNWSVVVPWLDCRPCRARRGRRTTPVGLARAPQQALPIAEGLTWGSGIPRSGSAHEFVREHRGWFGFAGVLLNPIMSEGGGVFTADTAMFLDEREPLAPVGGKGTSAEQALASCLGEGIERFAIAGGLDNPLPVTARGDDAECATAPWRDAVDFDGTRVELGAGDFVSLLTLDSLSNGGGRLFPASLVYAPYTPEEGHRSPTPSSTTGAAVGRTLDEATIQAVLELIERDSFWYYSRCLKATTKLCLDDHPLAQQIAEASGVQIHAAVMDNPFCIPVVHITLTRPFTAGGARTARGMGASTTLAGATQKGLIEAMQMLRSLDTGIDIKPSLTDMRALWFDGTSRDAFPHLFATDDRPAISWRGLEGSPGEAGSPDAVLDSLIQRANRAGVELYRHVFAAEAGFTAVRCIADRILPLDDHYFPVLNRFADWDPGITYGQWSYGGPLFM